MHQNSDDNVRLNKYIALRLGVGRRSADDLIANGKVLVNGQPPIMGARVSQSDEVVVDGKRLVGDQPAYTYVLMNKPVGYVCSRRQQGSVQTIYSLLPPQYQHLKTVGRLDKNSSGILLLTNDGNLTQRLTHPKYAKIKQYEVTLDTPLTPLHHQLINDRGIDLPDGHSQLVLERLHGDDNTQWRVTMHEGRNRQIRRTFAALGYTVTRLHRIVFGPFTVQQLHSQLIMPINFSQAPGGQRS